MKLNTMVAVCLVVIALFWMPDRLLADCVIDLPEVYESPDASWVSDQERRASAYHQNRLDDTYAEELAAGNVVLVAQRLSRLFRSEDWREQQAVQRKIVAQLDLMLNALQAAADAAESRVGSSAADAESVAAVFVETLAEQWNPAVLGMADTILDRNQAMVNGYFEGTEQEFTLFETCDDPDRVRPTLAQRELRQWRLLSTTLTKLIDRAYIAPIREQNVAFLSQSVKAWESFFDNGYSQMPWESLFNGRTIDRPRFGPPDRQWILLHPSFGIEMGTDSFEDLRVNEALLLELLGHVWYPNRDYRKYLGISTALALRNNANPGIGVVAHVRKNWSFGLAWHRELDGPQLFLSVDLFQYAKTRSARYEERYQDHKARLEEIFRR